MAPEILKAGLTGYPVKHSLSPLIHQTWAAREGVAIDYAPVAVQGGYEEFARTADRLAGEGWRGINITIPHKENALRYAQERGGEATAAARAAGAANIVTFSTDGPKADNSDAEGFAAGLSAILTANDARGRALVLGGGGAARGVLLALSGLGYRDIVIVNRTASRAEALAQRFGGRAAGWDARGALLDDLDLLVNATSLGMTGQPRLDLSLWRLPRRAIVSDIVYAPLETTLLKQAKARELRIMDGLSMLMHQAVPAYKAWFGREAAVDDDLRRRLVDALEKRDRA